MMVSSNSWSRHVKIVFKSILDDWKYSPDLHPSKFPFLIPTPVLPVDPLVVSPLPPPLLRGPWVVRPALGLLRVRSHFLFFCLGTPLASQALVFSRGSPFGL